MQHSLVIPLEVLLRRVAGQGVVEALFPPHVHRDPEVLLVGRRDKAAAPAGNALDERAAEHRLDGRGPPLRDQRLVDNVHDPGVELEGVLVLVDIDRGSVIVLRGRYQRGSRS